MSNGGEDVMKISAVQPLSVEAVEFSPAPATEQHRRSGRKTMSSGIGGSSPTEVVELPLSKAGGGGGEVHGGSGGSQTALNERRGKDISPIQWAAGCWKHRSRENSRDVECSPGRHAFQQAENAFSPDESPGRYTYGGGRVPGTVIDLGSGRTSGQ